MNYQHKNRQEDFEDQDYFPEKSRRRKSKSVLNFRQKRRMTEEDLVDQNKSITPIQHIIETSTNDKDNTNNSLLQPPNFKEQMDNQNLIGFIPQKPLNNIDQQLENDINYLLLPSNYKEQNKNENLSDFRSKCPKNIVDYDDGNDNNNLLRPPNFNEQNINENQIDIIQQPEQNIANIENIQARPKYNLRVNAGKLMNEAIEFLQPQLGQRRDGSMLHNCGQFNIKCSACEALHFSSLMIGRKSTFNDCCNHGKVEYPPVPEFNGIMKDIFNKVHPKHLNFMEYIRNYNSALACASLRGDIQVIPGRGPYIQRIQGIPIVQVGPLYPEKNNPSYAQFYIVDTREA